MTKAENKMGTAPVFKLIVSMSAPAMLSMLVYSMYNIVDSFFVAKISEEALTAVSYAYPIQILMVAVGVGTGVGINSLISRRLGAKKNEQADSAATHGILLALFSYILFAIFGIFFSKVFISSFTDIQSIVDMGVEYISVVTIFSAPVFISINIQKTLQATGNMIYPMVFEMVGAIVNIILDPIFIFGFGFIQPMGILGAAIATVLGQFVEMLLSVYIMYAKEHIVKISFKNFKFNMKTIKDIYAVGFPSIIMQAISSVMVVFINTILAGFTQTAVALFGIYFKLQSFVFMPVFGMTSGIMPILGYNFGAGNKNRLIKTLKIGSIIAAVIMTIGTFIFWFFTEQMLSIFEASPVMIEIGIPALRIISISFIPAAVSITFSTLFQAVGRGVYSLVSSVLRQLVILVPAAFVLSYLGLQAVWFAFPISDIIALIASVILFIRLYNKHIKTLDQKMQIV